MSSSQIRNSPKAVGREFDGFVEIDDLNALYAQNVDVHPLVSVALRDSTQEPSRLRQLI